MKRHLDTNEQGENGKEKQQKTDGNRCNKRAADTQANSDAIVKRRCRGKQADEDKKAADLGSARVREILRRQNKNTGRGRPKGSTKPDDGRIDRDGKMLTVCVEKNGNHSRI